jgi:predicted amidohydrolase YtcJ
VTGLLIQAQENCFRAGLTTVCDAGLNAGTVSLFDVLDKDSTLKIRIYAMLNPTTDNFNSFIRHGPLLHDRLRVRSVKLYADGSLGSRTALLKRPYDDMRSLNGIQVTSADSIRKVCRMCLEYGYQVNTHAIGDSANKLVLDVYGEFLGGKNDRRWRIEHCQVIDAEDLYKFKKYSVIPSIQATHATSDMKWAGNRLGPERIKGAYAYKALLDQNGWLANGTDFPIENISPIYTFYASVTRKDLKGLPPEGFQSENALSREDALRSITIWAAKADFWEKETGSLETGKNADFVVLDRDIMKVSEKEIPMTTVLSTYISGIAVYKKP